MTWILRAPNGRKPQYSSAEYFSIKLNHDGNIVRENMIEYYVGGTVSYIDYCDNDRISRIELHAMCKEFGYVEEVDLFYKVCGLDEKCDYDLSEDDDALFDESVNEDVEWYAFLSFDSSSDEDREDRPKYRKYRPIIGKVQPIIEDKMIFKNRAQFVEAIRQHAIVNGKAITFEKNDTDRVRAHCVSPCPWHILASSISSIDRKTLQVKTFNPNHKQCGWNWSNKLLNSSWLARTYFKEFKIKPSWPVTEIVEQVKLLKTGCGILPELPTWGGPKIVKLLEKNIALCKEYIVVLTGDNQFETRGFHGNNFCVDMTANTCSCRRWELTGIPCAHALYVLRESNKKPENIGHEYYKKQTYINTYKHVIYPMNGMDMWEQTSKPPIQPPHYTRKGGRPKKCRRRDADEPPAPSDGTKKMRRNLKKLSCRRCGGKGHNVRTCPSGFTAQRSTEMQCSQPQSQPMFTLPSQVSQPTPATSRIPKAPSRRGGIATRGGAARRGGAAI
ncbi:hypothetical protein RHSIM_Rhsim13G0199100 [Rhododendron simsii]|uniref:SWIM-type domain-containing protein n=1 Tax=Rhododendron simsii TaxID=118357 RepID=A0A834L7P1_RHOSS|nr:hypothetical protein RHSIM_Rhsim13G0199100 [Rhododendron simsii]